MDYKERVERTVFLDKCMVSEILASFLIIMFDEDNKGFENKLRSMVKSNPPDKAGLGLIVLTLRVVDKLYEMYQERERREDESWDIEEDGERDE